MNKITTIQEFDSFIAKELSTEQKAILSFALMFNPEHIDYYIAFKSHDFEFCKQYILDNKEEISIDKVPENFIEQAKMQTQMFKSMSQEEIDEIYTP